MFVDGDTQVVLFIVSFEIFWRRRDVRESGQHRERRWRGARAAERYHENTLKEHCSTEWNQLNIIPGYQPMSDGDRPCDSVMSCDTIGRDGRDVTRHIWILMSSAKTNMSSQWTQQPLQLYLVSNSRSRFVWFKVSMLASASWNYWTEWSYRSACNVWEWSWMRPVNSRGNSDLIITKNNNCVLVFQHRSSNTRDAEI